MREMYFKSLTEADRKRNEYLDSINHAPYFTIILIIAMMMMLFTLGVSIATF
ncbi:MAG: hypothetical protein AAF915_23435 [Cyanobacteria bacterium P01_D01_bin.50]